MLTINTRNDKLAAAWIDFLSRGMLNGTCLSEMLHAISDDLDDNGPDEDTMSNSDGDGSDLDTDDNESDNAKDGPIDGPPILSEVTLVLKKGTLHAHIVLDLH